MFESNPTWSPDGKKIAFTRLMKDNSTRIYVVDSGGENEVELVDLTFANDFPAWSPRGDEIALVNRPDRGTPRSRICTVDPDGQNLKVIFEDPDERIGEIAWSDDGAQIIFSRDGGRIVFLDVVTHKIHTIHVPSVYLNAPDWSPNGQDITFSAKIFGASSVSRGIFIIDRNGNLVRTILMDTPPSRTDGLAWSPDGTKILFGLDGGLHTLDLNSENTELLIESASEPDWQDPSLPRSVTPRNKLASTWGDMKIAEKH